MWKQEFPMFALEAEISPDILDGVFSYIKQECKGLAMDFNDYAIDGLYTVDDTEDGDYKYIKLVCKNLNLTMNEDLDVRVIKIYDDMCANNLESGADKFFVLAFIYKNSNNIKIFTLIEEDMATHSVVEIMIKMYLKFGKDFIHTAIFDDCNFLSHKAFNLYVGRLFERYKYLKGEIES